MTVLQKPANYRSHSDIKILVKATENIKFFQEIEEDKGAEIHEQICRYMTHKYLAAGETVFQEGTIFRPKYDTNKKNNLGTIGTTFYIILKGSVSVCKMEMQNTSNNTQCLNPNSIGNTDKLRPSVKKSESMMVERNKSVSPEKIEKIGEKNVVLTEVRVLEIGNSFGELALIENKPRAATIKCKENCHFAVLDKQFFGHILSKWGV